MNENPNLILNENICNLPQLNAPSLLFRNKLHALLTRMEKGILNHFKFLRVSLHLHFHHVKSKISSVKCPHIH